MRLDIYTKPDPETEDDYYCFAAPTPHKRILAVGYIHSGQPPVIVADAEELTPEVWLARRAAECGVTADHLPEACQAAHEAALAERTDEVHQFAAMLDEMAAMDADLAALRIGIVEPIVRLTPEQLDEIERDRPGEDYCTRPYLY